MKRLKDVSVLLLLLLVSAESALAQNGNGAVSVVQSVAPASHDGAGTNPAEAYGGAQTATDFPALAQSYLRGELKLDGLITQRISLDDINRGFDDLKAGRAIRSVIVFGDPA